MTTEIRNFGDGKTIILYTDEQKLFTRLKNSVKCFKVIPYHQDQPSKGKVVLVGADLYFPRRYQRWLERQINGDFHA